MSGLWALWVVYVHAVAADVLYVQPLRRRQAAEARASYGAGALSFGLRVGVVIFTLLLLARTFVLDVYSIPTPSMEPNVPQGSAIWVNRLAYAIQSPLDGSAWATWAEPVPGEVFVFRNPFEPRTAFVKRVLAVAGDHVRVEGDRISVNGRWLNGAGDTADSTGPHLVRLGRVEYLLNDDPEVESDARLSIVVPEGHYFALGDNINHSRDSRVWGVVSAKHVIGRAL